VGRIGFPLLHAPAAVDDDDAAFLALTREQLIEQIKLKESQLRKQQLMHQIRLKETELQQLLAGGLAATSGKEFTVPPSGRWKIQSQRLGGQPVPDGKWILPGQQETILRHDAPAELSLGI
jgi:hypothetical protein